MSLSAPIHPESFFDYTTMIETLLAEDPFFLQEAAYLPATMMVQYIKAYHTQFNQVTTPLVYAVRKRYAENLLLRFAGTLTPDYQFYFGVN